MTVDEKFDKLFALIEQKIKFTNKSSSVIAEEIAQEFGCSLRELSSFFTFVSGQTLTNYVKERKMMAAYESILNSEKYDANKAVELSGFADQPTFNKRFKIVFGLTPTEAFEKKDPSLLKVKLSWDKLQGIRVSSNAIKTIFGIDRAKFDEIKEIIKLQDKFKFDELQSEIAYYLYKSYEVPLKEAFRFVGEYHYNENAEEELIKELEDVREFFNLPPGYIFAEEEETIPRLSREELLNTRIKGDIDDPEIRYVYFRGDMDSIYTTYEVIDKLHEAGETDVTKVDIDVINICAYEEINVKYCKKAVAYFKANATEKHGKDAFREYIEYILRDVPTETAFENIYQLEGWDDYSEYTVFDMGLEHESAEYENEVLGTFTDFSARTDDREEPWYDYFSEEQ